MSASCLFCRIALGEIPATIIARNATCLAFRDIAPQAPVHVLVIPVKHAQSLNDAAALPVLSDLLSLAREVVRTEAQAVAALEQRLGPEFERAVPVFAHHLGSHRIKHAGPRAHSHRPRQSPQTVRTPAARSKPHWPRWARNTLAMQFW